MAVIVVGLPVKETDPLHCSAVPRRNIGAEAPAMEVAEVLCHLHSGVMGVSYERCTVYLRAHDGLTPIGSCTTIITARPEQAHDGIPGERWTKLGAEDTGRRRYAISSSFVKPT
jgi:hypothetical protein